MVIRHHLNSVICLFRHSLFFVVCKHYKNYEGNEKIYSYDFFKNLPGSLAVFNTSNYLDCCQLEVFWPNCTCNSPTDASSNCGSLIPDEPLRYVMWFLIVLIFGRNIFSLLMRVLLPGYKKVQNLLICSLSMSDLLMGVYVAGIVYKDVTTRHEFYGKYGWDWQIGLPCKALGAISVISSEVSVFTLVFTAYDRFLYVVYGLENKKLSYRTAVGLLITTWLVSSILAVLPALDVRYFMQEDKYKSFYGGAGMCLPLQLGKHSLAWEYCIAIFGVLNFVAALFLIVQYIRIFYSFYTTTQKSAHVALPSDQRSMAKRFAAIVLTDVFCWVPISLLLFTVVLDTRLVDKKELHELYKWFSICVFPINSAINPLLHTFFSPTFWNFANKRFNKLCISCRKGPALPEISELNNHRPAIVRN